MKEIEFQKRQVLLPELPQRRVPDKPLKPARAQDESLTPLERAAVVDGQKELVGDVVVFDRGLFGGGSVKDEPAPYEVKFKLQTFTVHDSGGEGKKFRAGSKITGSNQLDSFARGIYATLDADKEHFVVLCLNNKNQVNGFKLVSTGTLTQSLVHPREVFRAVLALDAAAIAFLHNHPSGDPAPSPEDIEITRRLKECADIFGIRVLDHLVLGDGRYFSFGDRGLL